MSTSHRSNLDKHNSTSSSKPSLRSTEILETDSYEEIRRKLLGDEHEDNRRSSRRSERKHTSGTSRSGLPSSGRNSREDYQESLRKSNEFVKKSTDEEMIQEIEQLRLENDSALDNIISMASNACKVGSDTVVQLEEQSEQLNRIEDHGRYIDLSLQKTDRIMTGMGSLSGNLKVMMTSDPKMKPRSAASTSSALTPPEKEKHNQRSSTSASTSAPTSAPTSTWDSWTTWATSLWASPSSKPAEKTDTSTKHSNTRGDRQQSNSSSSRSGRDATHTSYPGDIRSQAQRRGWSSSSPSYSEDEEDQPRTSTSTSTSTSGRSRLQARDQGGERDVSTTTNCPRSVRETQQPAILRKLSKHRRNSEVQDKFDHVLPAPSSNSRPIETNLPKPSRVSKPSKIDQDAFLLEVDELVNSLENQKNTRKIRTSNQNTLVGKPITSTTSTSTSTKDSQLQHFHTPSQFEKQQQKQQELEDVKIDHVVSLLETMNSNAKMMNSQLKRQSQQISHIQASTDDSLDQVAKQNDRIKRFL